MMIEPCGSGEARILLEFDTDLFGFEAVVAIAAVFFGRPPLLPFPFRFFLLNLAIPLGRPFLFATGIATSCPLPVFADTAGAI